MTEQIKALHFKTSNNRHARIPYLWRVRCFCGWNAFAATEGAAQAAVDHHISEEEPFPDIGLDPEPGSEADKRRN